MQLGQEIDVLRESLRTEGSRRVPAATRDGVDRAIGDATAQLKANVVSAAESVTKKLSAELKQTNKAVADLARKFKHSMTGSRFRAATRSNACASSSVAGARRARR